MKVVTRAAAVAAMIFLAGISSQALALDAFWHGVRSSHWGDGISGSASNWYSMAPPSGQARDVPDGTATLAAGAMQFTIIVDDDQTIGRIQYTADAPLYRILVFNTAHLVVNGAGLVQASAVRPVISVGGTLRFINSARVVNSGPPPLFVTDEEGSIQFRGNSRGGKATADVPEQGEVTFFDDASADQMTIDLEDYGTAYFYGRSNGGNATFRTQGSAELRFDRTKGPGSMRELTARSINNRALVMLGINTLSLQSAYTQSGGTLSIAASRARVGKLVARTANLGGSLSVTGAPDLMPGNYVLIQAGARSGTFTNVFFNSFPTGSRPQIRYIGNNVVLVVR